MPPETSAQRLAAEQHRAGALTESEIATAPDATATGAGPPAAPSPVDVPLPLAAPDPGGATLADVLARRRTRREPPDEALDVEVLATLLGAAAAVMDDGRRPHPSAGARYPLRLDVVARRCDGVAPGVHRYEPAVHALRSTSSGDRTSALEAAFGRAWVREARAVLVVSVDLADATAAHGVRGYRYALLEAGHLAQNLLLLATAAQLPACPLGGFADATLRGLVAGTDAGTDTDTDTDTGTIDPLYAVVV